MISETERKYIIWQNRAFRFYLAARLLYQKEQFSPAAFCAIQAIEALMKATLIYWDKSFNPESVSHRIAGMIKAIKNKAKNGNSFCCPEYFYRDKRFQSVTRYPANGKGVLIPNHFLEDLDSVFFRLIKLVPFQFNSELKHALSGKKRIDLKILRYKNRQMRALRVFLKVKLSK
ncbi:MAG: HEPN domain-containing protein [Gammaproteobacteria bacterium]